MELGREPIMQLPPDMPIPAATPADGGLTILGAVREQLGLELQSQKGLVEIFIIDHAEEASEN
jgi:uncharacterized protein (TIGR03435 family)